VRCAFRRCALHRRQESGKFDFASPCEYKLDSFREYRLTADLLPGFTENMEAVPENSTKKHWLATMRAACMSFSIGRRKAATVAAATLALGVAYHVVFGANGLTMYEHKRRETQLLAQQMQDLQRQNDQLRGHVMRLQNDPDAIEHEAHEELHYTRPGEVIYSMPGK
jgi:cell division protein FtsB